RFVRIDAAREQRLETLVDARAAERLLDQRVEAESRQMAVVEHDGVAQIDRPAVVDVLGQHVEQLPRTGAIAAILLESGRPVEVHPLTLIRNGAAAIVEMDEMDGRPKQMG